MNILITGVNRGLGKIICDYFHERKNRVIGIDIDEQSFNDNVDEYYCLDLNKVESIPDKIELIKSNNKEIDILINNAGLKLFKNIDDISFNDIIAVYNVNIISPIIITKSLIEVMKRNNYGRIINISSNASFRGYSKGSLYNSTKSALNLFTESIKYEIDKYDNITINAVCPETINTKEYGQSEKIGKSKLVNPERIIYVIDRIIKDKSINGNIIPVISRKSKIKYFLSDLKKNLKWNINHY